MVVVKGQDSSLPQRTQFQSLRWSSHDSLANVSLNWTGNWILTFAFVLYHRTSLPVQWYAQSLYNPQRTNPYIKSRHPYISVRNVTTFCTQRPTRSGESWSTLAVSAVSTRLGRTNVCIGTIFWRSRSALFHPSILSVERNWSKSHCQGTSWCYHRHWFWCYIGTFTTIYLHAHQRLTIDIQRRTLV